MNHGERKEPRSDLQHLRHSPKKRSSFAGRRRTGGSLSSSERSSSLSDSVASRTGQLSSVWALPIPIQMLLRVAYRRSGLAGAVLADIPTAGFLFHHMPAQQTMSDSSSVGSLSLTRAMGLALFSGGSDVDNDGGGVRGSATTVGGPESLTAAGWPATPTPIQYQTLLTGPGLDWQNPAQ